MTDAVVSLFVRKLQANAEYYAQHPDEIDLMFEDCFSEAAQIEAIDRGDRDAINCRV
nr:MAG TPA: hypothetical protein [Caudoviricetes sp.]